MTYKLLLLDIDGTLTESNQHALPSAIVCDAVKRAQEKLQVAVATGRAIYFAEPVTSKLGLKGPSIFNGGAEIIDITSGKVLQKRYLEVGVLRELFVLAAPFGYDIYTGGDKYENALKHSSDITEPSAMLFMDGVKNDDALHVLAQLNGVPGVEAHPTSSWQSGDVVDIHATHELATKRHGAEELFNMLGVNKEEVIAVGDGYNDVPMLEAAGLKVVMGNAPDEVKKLADYIAPSLAEDGVADVINRFILYG